MQTQATRKHRRSCERGKHVFKATMGARYKRYKYGNVAKTQSKERGEQEQLRRESERSERAAVVSEANGVTWSHSDGRAADDCVVAVGKGIAGSRSPCNQDNLATRAEMLSETYDEVVSAIAILIDHVVKDSLLGFLLCRVGAFDPLFATKMADSNYLVHGDSFLHWLHMSPENTVASAAKIT